MPVYDSNFGNSDSICCEKHDDYSNCGDLYRKNDNDKQQWVCSWSYSTSVYGLHTCPFSRTKCGPNSKVNFYQAKDDGAIHIKNLQKGEVCTYNVESVCGAPSFKVANHTNVLVWFTEWQQDSVAQSQPIVGKPFTSLEVQKASPQQGMPQKNVKFSYEEDVTEGSLPRYGFYKNNTWKSWGNVNQDGSEDSEVGRRFSEKDNECTLRNMMVSVLSRDENDAQLLLEVQSQTFGGIWLQGGLVGLAALISSVGLI
mmetsp:Transcript_31131/g.47584  ORF Transcript_31131/g.47584 Transcript_31131/m.47584 type:complete len:255 (-) Transcript_31131:28-792(-)